MTNKNNLRETDIKSRTYYHLDNLIPDFGVSMAILILAGIFYRWCKLNFGLIQGHVKACHFTAILLKG